MKRFTKRLLTGLSVLLLSPVIACMVAIHFWLPLIGLGTYSGRAPYFVLDSGYGTGFFINLQGYILTNRHVVSNCRTITIAGDGFNAKPAELVAYPDDSRIDLALIRTAQIPTTGLIFSDMFWPSAANNTELGLRQIQDMLAAQTASPYQAHMIGFPASNRGMLPTSTLVMVERAASSGDKLYWSAIFDGSVMQGNSGSPVIDQNNLVAGIAFAATYGIDPSTNKPFENQLIKTNNVYAGVQGLMIPAATAVAFIRSVGVTVLVSSKREQLTALPSPIVRIFCFHTWPVFLTGPPEFRRGHTTTTTFTPATINGPGSGAGGPSGSRAEPLPS